MKTYELTYIISPEITLEEAEAKTNEIESVLQKNEGVILKQSKPAAKVLAFPIEKNASGFLGVLEFQIEPEKLSGIEETIKKDGKIIRHIVIIKETARRRKERGNKRKPAEFFTAEQKTQESIAQNPAEEKPAHGKAAIEKEKVELKDIEQKLDEILGE